jgi:hypothetical protein
MSVKCVKSRQIGYDFENWPSDVKTDYSSLTAMGMVEFLKVKDKMLDNFEKELEDC